MKSYLIRRLLPIYIFCLSLELIFMGVTMTQHLQDIDFSFVAVLKTLAILILTTSVSFLFMMIPYVLFLTLLPKSKQNSWWDKSVSIFIYAIIVYSMVFEEAASMIFWEEFVSAFNFIAVDYLIYTNEVVSNIWQSYPAGWILLGILATSILIVVLTRKYLFTNLPAPRFSTRLLQTIAYSGVCFLAYQFVDISNLEINKNRYNNEIAKEGTYSLFSAFLKNELSYPDFYLTQDEQDNLQILQQKLGRKNAKFINPEKNIARQISSSQPEKEANIVIVLMESMSSKYLDENRQPNERMITPNLTKLSKEGIFFSQAYATGTRSVRGIEALTLGVPPLPGMSLVRRNNNEKLHNIGSILGEKGYNNKWIYGGYGYFDNMNYFFENNGFQVLDRKTWDKGEVTFANAWGAADEDTYDKAIKEADKSYAQGKPFLTVILSISNHRPYTYPEGRIDLPPEVSKRDGSVKYADYAIGKFVEDAKKKPWFDNTVFVFVADHTAGAAGSEEINLEGHHIPWIIYAPKLFAAQRIDHPVSQIDALPTLFGLLNLDYESRFYGQDALEPGYEPRYFVSNYQKIGYVKNGVNLILKPVKQFSYSPENSRDQEIAENRREAIAFYQQASNWIANLKEQNATK